MPSPTPHRRADYPHCLPIATRWMNNDIYGHVNNVVYYSYFDTVINRWLVDEGGLDIHGGDIIGLCVDSRCAYLRPVAFPDALEAGLRVAHLGRSSVRYEIAVFKAGDDAAVAQGEFVHVFVARQRRRSAAIPAPLRAALARLVVG